MPYKQLDASHTHERELVEKALQNITRAGGSITNAEIASAVDLPINRVRMITSHLKDNGSVESYKDGSQTFLKWRGPQKRVAVKPIRNGTTSGNWIAPRWELARPGAEDHKQHGSRRGDEVQEWKAPISMCVGKGVEKYMPDRLQR
jgi:hypothetical protein